jgi:hypothetical protein
MYSEIPFSESSPNDVSDSTALGQLAPINALQSTNPLGRVADLSKCCKPTRYQKLRFALSSYVFCHSAERLTNQNTGQPPPDAVR